MRWLSLYRKRRQLKEARDFLDQIEDQIHSGRITAHQWQQKVDRLQCEIYALESPDDIVRRAQQA